MKEIQEKGSALTFVIVGTFAFFGVMGVVLWLVFSYLPERNRQAALQELEIVRAEEAKDSEGVGMTVTGGIVTMCTKKDGTDLMRYYLNGPRVRVAERTSTTSRVSLWDGEILARYDANGSKKWFKVPDADVTIFHESVVAMKAETTFACEELPYNALHFRRVDDPLALED